jgi:hypothetical protein
MISNQSSVQAAASVELSKLESELEKFRGELQACKNFRAILAAIRGEDFPALFTRHAPPELISFLQTLAGMEVTRCDIARLMAVVAD